MSFMKLNIFIAVFIFFVAQACQNKETAKTAAIPTTKMIAPDSREDSTAIADVLHGFFTWFDANQERIGKINYINDKGKHLKLDEKLLQDYLAEVKKSGFVCDEFVADEMKFYQTCSKAWQTEDKGDVPTGLDADRYHCAQDFIAPYNTGAVTSTITGDRAKAILTLTYGDSKSDFKFDMKKEGNKWFLAKIDCDLGVKY